MFNALKYTQKLEEAGFTREQAEASVTILWEVLEMNLATKDDILRLEKATSADIQRLEQSTSADIQRLEQSTSADIQRLEKELESTRGDIQRFEKGTQEEFKSIRSDITSLENITNEMKGDIIGLDKKIDLLTFGLERLENKLIVKLGGLMAFSVGILAALIRLK